MCVLGDSGGLSLVLNSVAWHRNRIHHLIWCCFPWAFPLWESHYLNSDACFERHAQAVTVCLTCHLRLWVLNMAEVSLHLEILPWAPSLLSLSVQIPSPTAALCCLACPCTVAGFLLKLLPCCSQVTLQLGSTIWCWCNLQTYENSLLPRAVKQTKLGVRWSQISFMNGIMFQTLGLEDAGHYFAILHPVFWFGVLGFLFLQVLFLIWYFAQTEIPLFLKCWKVQIEEELVANLPI